MIIAFILTVSASTLMAQTETAKLTLYHPEANAKEEIADAVAKAKKERKKSGKCDFVKERINNGW